MKNSFIAFALCMVGGQVHGVSSNNDSAQILCNMMDKNVLVGGMLTLLKVRQSTESPSLRTVPKGPLQEINKYMTDMTDLSWTTMDSANSYMTPYGSITAVNDNLPVACIKKDKKVVATRIDNNRHGGQVRLIICNLQDYYGTQVPIQVHTPHRGATFGRVTGKLYSDAQEVTVFNSCDLDMYIKPGDTLTIYGHSSHLRTNAHKTEFFPPRDFMNAYNNMTMICDNGNKQVTISTNAPDDKPVTVKLDNFQGTLLASGPQTTVKVQNSHCERATIGNQAKALFDHTTIKGGVDLADHASLVLCGSNVTGPINGTSNSDVFKVDSTGTVDELNWLSQKCGDYTVSSKGNLAHVPALMAKEIARKNPDDTQKAEDTVQKFDALWAKYYMPQQTDQEESKK